MAVTTADLLDDVEAWFVAQRQITAPSQSTSVLLVGPVGTEQAKLAREAIRRLKSRDIVEEKAPVVVINFLEIAARRAVRTTLNRLKSCVSNDKATIRCVLLLNLNELKKYLTDPAYFNLDFAEVRLLANCVTSVLDSPGSLCVATADNELNVPSELRRGDRLSHISRLGRPSRAERLRILEHREENEPRCVVDKTEQQYLQKVAAVTPGWTEPDLVRLRVELELASTISGPFRWETTAVDRALSARARILSRGVSPRLVEALSRDTSEGNRVVLAGYQAARHQLDRLCSWPVDFGDSFKRLGTAPPRGILLHGPSGCGKTSLANSVQERLTHANFLRVRGTDLFSRYLGDSEELVRELFSLARSLNPCVVLLDELDTVGSSRADESSLSTGGVERRVLGSLLTELDGLGAGSENQVFLLGCTNKLSAIDSALLRPGRIDHLIEVNLPDYEDRTEILRTFFEQLSFRDPNEVVLARLVLETEGYSCAKVRQRCEVAVKRAVREGQPLSAEHFT